jgi:prophage regulatory protein
VVVKKEQAPDGPADKIVSVQNQPARETVGSEPNAIHCNVGRMGQQPTVRVLRLDDVMRMTSLGKTTIYQLQKPRKFPASVRMTARAVGWMEHEILSWIQTRMAAREFSRDVAGIIRP